MSSSHPADAQARPVALSVPPLQPTVIAFGRLGDMVMVSSVLHLLHARFGRRCLLIGAGAWSHGLYANDPDVERVLCLPRHAPFMVGLAWWRVLAALHRNSPGPVYVCECQPGKLARIRRMLAMTAIDSARCLFISDNSIEEEHCVDRFLRLAQMTPRAIDASRYPLPPPSARTAPRLNVSQAERTELATWLRRSGWLGRSLVLIQPGNFRSMSKRREQWRHKADDKAWPVANWIALLHRVLAAVPGALAVLCGAPQEAPMLQQIVAAAGLADVVAAPTSLRRLLALSEAAHSMISIDTGPAHAAAALGVPLVVLFGAQSPGEWLPRGPGKSTVIGIGGPPVSNRVDQISVDQVFAAWCSLLPAIQLRHECPPPGARMCELT